MLYSNVTLLYIEVKGADHEIDTEIAIDQVVRGGPFLDHLAKIH